MQALAGLVEPSQQNLLDNEEKQKPGGDRRKQPINQMTERRGEENTATSIEK